MESSTGRLYWRGTGMDALAETDLAGAVQAEYVFFNGKRIARREGSGNTVFYYFSDHLGSASVLTDAAGTIVEESDYYPFGGERVITNNDPNAYKFTGKERDVESGLDYFIARHYSSSLGRFLQPDEFTGGPVDAFSSNDPLPDSPLPYADITNPQSLNKYTYTYNNPLRYTDPNGHEVPTPELDQESLQAGYDVAAGMAKGLYNMVASGWNTFAAVINTEAAMAGQSGNVMHVDSLPEARYSNATQAISGGAAQLTVVAYSAAGAMSKAGTAERAAVEPHPSVTRPYERPSGATTAEQRASVQGKPCVDCGKTESKMFAHHKTALSKEYYTTGSIDKAKMRSLKAVDSHCPKCSVREGAKMSQYSKQMKEKIPNQK